MTTEIHKVRGVTFHAREALGFVRQAAEHDVQVRLVPEPTNPHDPNAIRVEMSSAADPQHTWHHVGWIPRTEAAHVGELLAAGRVLGVGIIRHGTLRRDDGVPWLQIALQLSPDEGGTI